MSLQKYASKRNFKKTPEPDSAPKKIVGDKNSLSFVVHKHDATHLHFDLRLEIDGVLKSWAVPKGPSIDPNDKRLAIMTEDHPLTYGSFQGVIPEGNYGAGTVEIWDKGYYTPLEHSNKKNDEIEIKKQLKKGHLKIAFYGQKLHGEFSLVKMKTKKNNEWLLIKKESETAKLLKDAPKEKLPTTISPMLTQLVSKPFDKDNWLFEVKWDGYRAIARVKHTQKTNKIKLYSRNKVSFLKKFPTIVSALKKLDHTVVIDGEIVAFDEKGRPSFELLQEYIKKGTGTVSYVVFDLLHLNGHNLRKTPLLERKKILQEILLNSPELLFSEHIETKGTAFFEAAQKQNLEGIIAKDAQSAYIQGKRTASWQKIKTHNTQEAIVCGFTRPKGSREHFGSLILGVYQNNKLKYVGHTGSGFTQTTLSELQKKLKPLIRKKCPFSSVPKTNDTPTWVVPKLVVEIQFANWTTDDLIRQPVYLRLREDKTATEVIKESTLKQENDVKDKKPTLFFGTQPPEKNKNEQKITIGKQVVKVSNLSKLFWLKEKYSKGDLITYYKKISQVLLPHLKDRPESLLRYPDGITGESFFQKNVGDLVPDWIKTVDVYSESEDKIVTYCLCQTRADLVYLVNLGCIDFNPWNSRIKTPEHPDFAVLDLDPESIDFSKVIKTAQTIHEILELADVDSFCKTSGSRGLHIYIPLGAKYSYEQARNFSLLIAQLTHQRLPKITSLERSPKKRQKKVYIDCYQNSKGQTLASAYSVRAVPGALVSTPLSWKEVTNSLDPKKFTIQTIQKRIQKVGDLFKPVLGPGIDMKAAISKLEKQSLV